MLSIGKKMLVRAGKLGGRRGGENQNFRWIEQELLGEGFLKGLHDAFQMLLHFQLGSLSVLSSNRIKDAHVLIDGSSSRLVDTNAFLQLGPKLAFFTHLPKMLDVAFKNLIAARSGNQKMKPPVTDLGMEAFFMLLEHLDDCLFQLVMKRIGSPLSRKRCDKWFNT